MTSWRRKVDGPAQSDHRYAHIDALRALAVMLVVIAHAGAGDIVPGGSGVTIFFVISGFIITNLLLKERSRTGGFKIREFYLRRFLKIAPPLITVLIIPTLVYGLYAEIMWRNFFAQIFFFFNWIYMQRVDPKVLPGSGVVWSLSIEEQFYIVFALIWLLAVRYKFYMRILSIVAGVGVIVPILLRFYFATSLDVPHFRVYYGTDTRVDAIALGVLAAIFYSKVSTLERDSRSIAGRIVQQFKSGWIVVVAVVMYVGSLVFRDEFFRETIRYSMQAFAACFIILFGLLASGSWMHKVLQRTSEIRVVQLVGLASYSIYLAHLEVAKLLSEILNDAPMIYLFPLKLILGVFAGALVWFFVEQPVERYKKRRTKRLAESSKSAEASLYSGDEIHG